MSINIICLGKNKDSFIEEGIKEFLKRLNAFDNVKFTYISDIKLTKTNSINIVKKKEASNILKNINNNHFIIALDERGTQMSSLKFSEFIQSKRSLKNLTFIIGGVYGLDKEIVDKADFILSFSNFTFTHRMIRLILIEQIYRAFTIINNKNYHY